MPKNAEMSPRFAAVNEIQIHRMLLRRSGGLQEKVFKRGAELVRVCFDVFALATHFGFAEAAQPAIRVFELVARENRHDVGAGADGAGTNQLAEPGDCGGGRWFAANAVFRERGLRFEDLVVRDGFAQTMRGVDGAQGFLPVHGIADTNGGGFGARPRDRNDVRRAVDGIV
jgi:hypothetical protein